jgi:universal stress protein A
MQWKKIICPVDFSEINRNVLFAAAAMAAEANVPLVLIHVWETPIAVGDPLGLDLETMARGRAELESKLAAWAQDAKDKGAKTVQTIFAYGVAWNEIVTAAEHDRAVDLIVIGTHGRTGLKRLFLGSVAEKVIRHAPCSVYVVRPR